MKNKITLVLGTFLFVFSLHARTLTSGAASKIARNFLRENEHPDYSLREPLLVNRNNTDIAYLFRLVPRGFVLVSTVETRNPVIGFSWENNFSMEDMDNNPVFSVLEGIHHERQALRRHPEADKPVKTKSFIVGPHVYTLWGQVNCHDASGNLINVTNLNTPNHCAVGCVAISLATILHYYKWPPKGKGSHSYYDGNGSLTGNHTANYAIEYPWELMKNKYNNQNSTLQERQAAGLLAYHAAVGVNMDFENGGSTSNVNQIPYALNHFFRVHGYYKNINSASFWVDVDKNMIEANPVAIAVENNNGNGHSMIIDGLKVEDNGDRFYHLNCGWWGSTNGWYALQGNFNAGTYTSILGGVIDAIPVAYIPQQNYFGTNVITLHWQYTHTIEANSFIVQQKIDDGDWTTLNDNVQDTSLLVGLADTLAEYYFRVKAKVNGEYYSNTWSNTMHLLHYPVGMSDHVKTAEIHVSPNPATSDITLSNIAKNTDIQIVDINGKVYFSQQINTDKSLYSIDISTWEKGVYILRVLHSGKVTSQKIVKY